MLNFSRLISLGRHCQTAHQIRRCTGDQAAFYFDWVGTPFSGLMHALKNDFCGCFQLENLCIEEGGTTVIDQATGFSYRHCFPRDPTLNKITQEIVAREYPRQRQKFDFLIARLRHCVASEHPLFIRQDTISRYEAEDLYNELSRLTQGRAFGLLLIQPSEHWFHSTHPNIFTELGPDLPTGPADWKGPDEVWDRILLKYAAGNGPSGHHLCAPVNGNRAVWAVQSADHLPQQDAVSWSKKRILIVPLPEAGHAVPTFKIASWLTEKQCEVQYLTSLQFRPVIEKCGATVIPLGDGVPEGQAASGQHIRSRLMHAGFPHNYITNRLAEITRTEDFDLVLLDCKNLGRLSLDDSVESNRLLIYATSLPNWDADLESEMGIPTVVFCPEEFEIPKFRRHRPDLYYVEPSLRSSEVADDSIQIGASGLPLILVTFGTQSIRDRKFYLKMELIIELARRRKDLEFVLASGKFDCEIREKRLLNNLTEYSYLPQRSLLKRASAIVTHGGLGTIKESIHAGVPMIVLPALFDQPFNAMRVRHHKLGEAIFEENLTANSMDSTLNRVLAGEYTEGIKSMQKIFCAREIASPSNEHIRRILSLGD